MTDPTTTSLSRQRLSSEDRRELLLDVARRLVTTEGPESVSMGTVADRAGVTRALVYKHFTNREDILGALYRREAAELDRAIRRRVTAVPDGFEPKLRAFIGAVMDAAHTHSGFFPPLRPFGHDDHHRRDQQAWDRRTVRFFATLAAEEHRLDRAVTKTVVAVLLQGIVAELTRSPSRRSAAERRALEDLLVEMAVASLTGLAGSAGSTRPAGAVAPGRSRRR